MTDAAEVGHRYWVRRLTEAAPENELIMCGVWAVEHLEARVRTRWVERVAYTAGRETTHREVPTGSQLVAEYGAFPAESAHAVLTYGAARLQRPDRAHELTAWLARSPAALAAHHTLRRRPPLVALDAWATWWSQTNAAQAYYVWGYAWDVMSRSDAIAAEVLLDAVSTDLHLGGVEGHTLSDPTRLLPHTTLAVAWHPHAHRVHALHGLALRRAGYRRAARRAYRRSRLLCSA